MTTFINCTLPFNHINNFTICSTDLHVYMFLFLHDLQNQFLSFGERFRPVHGRCCHCKQHSQIILVCPSTSGNLHVSQYQVADFSLVFKTSSIKCHASFVKNLCTEQMSTLSSSRTALFTSSGLQVTSDSLIKQPASAFLARSSPTIHERMSFSLS